LIRGTSPKRKRDGRAAAVAESKRAKTKVGVERERRSDDPKKADRDEGAAWSKEGRIKNDPTNEGKALMVQHRQKT